MKSFSQTNLMTKLLDPVHQWLDGIEVRDPEMARFLCKLIPASCPFEQSIQFLGYTVFHIPPLCKLNPFYEQVIGLRFRSLTYLVDECNEDIKLYC